MTSLAGTYIPFNINLFFTVYKNYLDAWHRSDNYCNIVTLTYSFIPGPADVLNHSGNK